MVATSWTSERRERRGVDEDDDHDDDDDENDDDDEDDDDDKDDDCDHLISVRDKYVEELSTYYATGVGKLETFEVTNIWLGSENQKQISCYTKRVHLVCVKYNIIFDMVCFLFPPSALWTWTLVSLRVKVEPTHFVPCFR